MAAKRDRFSYARDPPAWHLASHEQPLKRVKTSNSWTRTAGTAPGAHPSASGIQVRNFSWKAAPAAPVSQPAPRQTAPVSEVAQRPSTSQAGRPQPAPGAASGTQAAAQPPAKLPSQALRAAPNPRTPSAAKQNATALRAADTPGKQKPAGQRYAKKRPNQLLRVSPAGPKISRAAPPTQQKLTPKSRTPADATARMTPRPPGSLVHKGRHSLVRRTSIVSAAARTFAAARSPRPAQPSRKWVRLGVPSAASQPQQPSRFKPQTHAAARTPQPAAAGRGRGRGSVGSFQWQRGGGLSTPGSLAAMLAQRRAAKALQQRFAAGRGRGRGGAQQRLATGGGRVAGGKAPAKLVRMGGSLYRVSGMGGGRSLKRQVTPKPVPKLPGQAPRYQRQGNTLCRMLATTTPSPLLRIRQQAARLPRTGTPARRQPQASKASGSTSQAGRGGAKPLGMIAKIRRTTKFVNQTCFTYCRTGKCERKEQGSCPLVHEARNVAVCLQWLRGQCDKPDCPLQHKRRTALMPQCMHFLTGTCTAPDCAYLHVMLDEDAPVCKDFHRGYCAKGASCLQKHLTGRQLQQLRASKTTTWQAPKPVEEAPRKKRRRWPLPPEELPEQPAMLSADGEEEGLLEQ